MTHVADTHDVIEVRGARENNLRDVSLDLPKRRLTVFTGVSGSGKSSLVFGTIAAESQRMINETYSAFLQSFMGSPSRPDVDALRNLSAAIVVDQERMGANSRSTLGTATDAYTMLRIVFSRIGVPSAGSALAYSFNAEGMCPHVRGHRQGLQRSTSTGWSTGTGRSTTGAITVPNFSVDGWYVQRLSPSPGFFDPDKPLRDFTAQEWDDFLHKPGHEDQGQRHQHDVRGPGRQGPADVPGQGPRVGAAAHPGVHRPGRPPSPAARRAAAPGSSPRCWPRGSTAATSPSARPCRSATWPRSSPGCDEPSVAPVLTTLRQTLDSLVEIGLGYLSLDRESGTLSGGEAQRVKMVRHLGSSLTDVTYVFDEPTVGLHPHDIQRMNGLLLRLRDKGNTVLVVEHKPETIAIADHVVDLGPGAGPAGGRICFAGDVAGLRASGTLTGRHLDHRVRLRDAGPRPRPGSCRSRAPPCTT